MATSILQRIERFFDNLFETIGNVLLALIRRLAPFSVPAAPAFFLAHAVAAAADQLQPGWGLGVGVVAALGLESAGILGAHYAVKLYAARDGRWLLPTAATGAYLLIGITAIWLLESARDAQVVGTAMFLIAGIVYMLVGLAEVDRAEETAVSQAAAAEAAAVAAAAEAERRHRHELDLARLRYQHEEKLTRIKTKHAPHHATHTAASATHSNGRATQYECECGAVLRNAQAYAAHRRWQHGGKV